MEHTDTLHSTFCRRTSRASCEMFPSICTRTSQNILHVKVCHSLSSVVSDIIKCECKERGRSLYIPSGRREPSPPLCFIASSCQKKPLLNLQTWRRNTKELTYWLIDRRSVGSNYLSLPQQKHWYQSVSPKCCKKMDRICRNQRDVSPRKQTPGGGGGGERKNETSSSTYSNKCMDLGVEVMHPLCTSSVELYRQ